MLRNRFGPRAGRRRRDAKLRVALLPLRLKVRDLGLESADLARERFDPYLLFGQRFEPRRGATQRLVDLELLDLNAQGPPLRLQSDKAPPARGESRL